MPAFGIARQHVGQLARGDVIGVIVRQLAVAAHRGVAAVAIGAAEPDGGRLVHRRRIGADVARIAAVGLGRDLIERLPGRSRRRDDAAVVARHRSLFLGRAQPVPRQQRRGEDGGDGEKAKHGAHQ